MEIANLFTHRYPLYLCSCNEQTNEYNLNILYNTELAHIGDTIIESYSINIANINCT